MEQLVPQLDALLAFAAELDGRLQDTGVAGVTGVLALHERLKSALAGVSAAEIDARLATVDALRRELASLAAKLETVRRLQRALGG